jgi:hypothetical protein
MEIGFTNRMTKEDNIKLHLAIVLADMAYNVMFDVEEELKKKKIGLNFKLKQDFNLIESNVKRLQAILLQSTNEYVKYSTNEADNQMLYVSDSYNEIIKNLMDKLCTKDEGYKNFYKIWNYLESFKSSDIVKYKIPTMIKNK